MASPSEEATLADEWRHWVVDNLLRGARRDDLVATLVGQGVPEALAVSEVEGLARSPALGVCARLAVARDRRDQLLDLLLALRGDRAIERRPTVSADELFRHYWVTSTPLVLTQAIADWPALHRWSFDDFRERFGAVEVEVCTGRDADPLCDRNFREHLETMPFAAYLDRVKAAGRTNDLYMIAHNRAMERAGMARLLEDIVIDEALFDPAELIGGCTLWVGPAGTKTALHHDSTNIFFCQIRGTKRIRLISPFEASLLDHAQGFYAGFDPAAPRACWPEPHRDVVVYDVTLGPGEALFLPAGWWHQIEALDPSISFSLLSFRRPNRFDDYAPGNTRIADPASDEPGA